ncbi:unnamed protein product [Cunninghamella blakesleeana]
MNESTFEESLINDLEIPLEQETAIPAPKRGRNNSLIPVGLLNDKGRGNCEQAALATVFGVLEYSESKIFWERLPIEFNNNQHHINDSQLTDYFTNTHSFYSNQNNNNNSHQINNDNNTGSTTDLFQLPDIPTVSKFNDILVNDENGSDLLFPSNASSVLLHSMIPKLQRTKSESSIKSSFTFDSNLSHSIQSINNNQLKDAFISNESNDQVTTPLLFIGYPPSIFDLLKSDDDDRIIIWGPDPKDTSPTSSTTSSSASSSSTTRPTLRGFSSNTTTSSFTSSSTQDLTQRQQTLPEKLKRSLRSNSLKYRASTDNLRNILLLRRTFGNNNRLKKQSNEGENNNSVVKNTSKVVEAASVEKLVEKLTNTLDYEFMTDFFLTYRSFISPAQLCKLLILRFRWALENDDAERRIVRIRTFVVMRHWLLNYFVHDFIPSRELRVVLTTFLNLLPSHPLVKSSPRDQRIVKGLKRVVRRLKKVYYSGSNSQRVQVIAPPPPTSEQEKVEEMIRANLSNGILRRKTALVRGVDVGGKHNGNTAIQNAQNAPMVVIGSVRTSTNNINNKSIADNQSQTDAPLAASNMSILSSKRPPSVDTISKSVALPFSLKGSQSEEISSAKKSYFKRMEHEKRMNNHSSEQFGPSCTASQASIASDDSLESDLTPGTTEIASDEDDYFDQDDDDDEEEEEVVDGLVEGSIQYGDAGSSQQQPLNKMELERRRKEEEEERERAAFFSASNFSNLNNLNSISTVNPLSQQQKQLSSSNSGFDMSDSHISSCQRTLSSGSEAITPSISFDAIKGLDNKKNSDSGDLSHLSQMGATNSTIDTDGTGLNNNVIDMDDDDDNSFLIQHAATLAALEKFDGPIKKAAIGDMNSHIPRAPSSKWCQTNSDENNNKHDSSNEQLHYNIKFDDILSDDDNINNNNNSNENINNDKSTDHHSAPVTPTTSTSIPIGLSRHLSRKSIERRKSEKSLRHAAASSSHSMNNKSASTPNSPHHRPTAMNNHSEIPPMPEISNSESLINSKDEKSPLENKNNNSNNTDTNSNGNTKIIPVSPKVLRSPSFKGKPISNDEFEAIPYDQTVSLETSGPSSTTPKRQNSLLQKRGLSKKLVNMVFSKSNSTNNENKKEKAASPNTKLNFESVESSSKIQLDDEIVQSPTIVSASASPSLPSGPTPVASTSKKTISSVNSTLVSRIAQELRESEREFEIECDCMRCTGNTTGPRACRRFSLALLSDDAKRHSLELKLKRRGSSDRKNKPSKLGLPDNHPPLSASAAATTRLTKNGPMYLGQLGTINSESDLDVHIQEVDEDTDDSQDDDDSSDSSDSEYIEYLNDTNLNRHSKQVHLSNGSLDRLTGIATKGDDASIHRRVFSVTTNQSRPFLDDVDPVPSLEPPQEQHQQEHQHRISVSLEEINLNHDPLIDTSKETPPWEIKPDDVLPPLHTDDQLPINPQNNPMNGFSDIDAMQNLLQDISSMSSSFVLSYRSSKLAQQFCFVERDVLLGVDWEEMVHCRWTKMTKETTQSSKMNNDHQHDDNHDDHEKERDSNSYSPNETDSQINYTRENRKLQLDRQDTFGGIEQVIERFNTVCQWVASEIVSVEKLDTRVKVVEKFIRLAQKCRTYSNYATLVQILLGLQSPSVSRLKKTWARVRAKEMKLLEELSQFTSPMRNWKHIRDNMTVVAEEYGMSPTEVQVEMPGATGSGGSTKGFKLTKVKIPFGGCIPFLGIYLSDLVFNSEQPPYLEPNHTHHKIYKEQIESSRANLEPVLKQPLVNFRKHRITATVIKRVLTFQNLSRRYAFDLDDELYERCYFLDSLDTESIRQLSHAIE